MVPIKVTTTSTLPEATDRPTAPHTYENLTFSKPGRKNMLALKLMVYQRIDKDDFFENLQ